MKPVTDPEQSMQRVKVGMTGLAVVLLMIALASVVFRLVSHERPVSAPGASKPEVLANLSPDDGGNAASEPLAEIGVAPSGQSNTSAPAARP